MVDQELFHSTNCDVLDEETVWIFPPADDSSNENMSILPSDHSLDENRDGERLIPAGKRWDDSPTC